MLVGSIHPTHIHRGMAVLAPLPPVTALGGAAVDLRPYDDPDDDPADVPDPADDSDPVPVTLSAAPSASPATARPAPATADDVIRYVACNCARAWA